MLVFFCEKSEKKTKKARGHVDDAGTWVGTPLASGNSPVAFDSILVSWWVPDWARCRLCHSQLFFMLRRVDDENIWIDDPGQAKTCD